MGARKIAVFNFILLLFAVSCSDSENVWQQSVTIPKSVWDKDSVLKFNIPVIDTVSTYTFYVNIRNRLDYDYQNLYLFIRTEAPNGGVTVDTLNYTLAYSSGEWTGKGGIFSKYRENTFMYRNYVMFPVTGIYTVSLRHGMRDNSLQGIASAGLILRNFNN
ncbi:MAG: gliding motility lipoprotein GldH [Prevotellaceae bacterium]|jgi:gliding motility-associated lipoprotein GldH|nr:gliding motility lipoprotein GldH [Prevotellaceae bacterium]